MTKFLTYEDRLEISAYEKKSGYSGWPYNACGHRVSCKFKNVCGKECTHKSSQYCKLCSRCNDFCQEFVEEICIAKFKPPYVCNGCSQYYKCTLKKRNLV